MLLRYWELVGSTRRGGRTVAGPVLCLLARGLEPASIVLPGATVASSSRAGCPWNCLPITALDGGALGGGGPGPKPVAPLELLLLCVDVPASFLYFRLGSIVPQPSVS